jgi:excisionase family DNA binding protein
MLGRRPRTRSCREGGNLKPIPDPQALPQTFPVQTASRILGIGRNRTYELIKSGDYPVRVIDRGGRYRVSRWDLLKYLGAAPDDTGPRK